MSTWKHRHENQEPLVMDETDWNDWHKWRGHLGPEGHKRSGTLFVKEEWDQLWLVWVYWLCWVASASSNQAAEYDQAVATFIPFKSDSVSKLRIIHFYEHIPLYFFFSFYSWAWRCTWIIFPRGAIVSLFNTYPIKILDLLVKCRHQSVLLKMIHLSLP